MRFSLNSFGLWYCMFGVFFSAGNWGLQVHYYSVKSAEINSQEKWFTMTPLLKTLKKKLCTCVWWWNHPKTDLLICVASADLDSVVLNREVSVDYCVLNGTWWKHKRQAVQMATMCQHTHWWWNRGNNLSHTKHV